MLVRTLRWNSPVASEMDRLFGSVLSALPGFASAPARAPAINGWEDAEAVYVEAEVPGIPMDQIEITVQGDELTLKGQRPAPKTEGTLRQERWTGSFERHITLPVPIDAEKVEASLTNGVLTIKLPKAASARARKVQIRG